MGNIAVIHRQTVVTRKLLGWLFVAATCASLVGLALYYELSKQPGLGHSATTAKNLLASGWAYMPGVVASIDGLHVSYLGRAIVRQDGSAGQDNPAVNLYGTSLSGDGDVTLRVTLQDIKGGADLRLYGDVPMIQDEFRVEPNSLDIKVEGDTATVSAWRRYANGSAYNQSSTQLQRTSLASTNGTVSLVIRRQAEHMSVNINGKDVATMTNIDSLRHAVWFGVSAMNPGDSWKLTQLQAEVASGVSVVGAENTAASIKEADSLQMLAQKKRPGFLVGAAVALGPLVADRAYAKVALGGNFGQFTTENVLKWQFIHPQPAVYDFHEADAVVDLARKNHIAIHGHTLVFGEANPAWVQQLPVATSADKEHVRQVMVDHIAQTVGHFKGKIASWDVVNEPLADYDTPAGVDGLRQHIWYRALGEEYIATAFAAARQADPQAKLFINEFGLEADDERWQTFLNLVTKLKNQGVPIDGVGFQAHVYERGDEIDPAVLRDHIRQLAKLGLVSRISEMDVHDKNGTGAQAVQYAAVFAACLAEESCVSWSTWGVTDRYNLSLDDTSRIVSGSDFLWDKNAQPKQAVSAIRATLTQ